MKEMKRRTVSQKKYKNVFSIHALMNIYTEMLLNYNFRQFMVQHECVRYRFLRVGHFNVSLQIVNFDIETYTVGVCL